MNVFSTEVTTDDAEHMRERNFFCLGFMKISPLFAQSTLYANGTYNEAENHSEDMMAPVQVREGLYKSSGIDYEFYNSWNVMKHLNSLTHIDSEKENTFSIFCNEMTHQAVYLQMPDYEPAQVVDNSAYKKQFENYNAGGMKMHMDDEYMVSHYQCNVSAMLLLADWLDYLRENGVYDNTRIIIASDHGRDLYQFDELKLSDGEDALQFSALLMVKDFGAEGFTTSEEFMANADVPTLAFEGLINDPVNPFTGKEINSDEKTAHDQLILLSRAFSISKNNGKTFKSGKWYAVHDDMYDRNNWTYKGKH
jgi:hypothetical protein